MGNRRSTCGLELCSQSHPGLRRRSRPASVQKQECLALQSVFRPGRSPSRPKITTRRRFPPLRIEPDESHFPSRRWCPFFRNLVLIVAKCHTLATMSETPESVAVGPSSATSARVQDRPFRVKLRGSVLTLMRLPNRREVRGKLHQLSTTGGLMHLEKPLDEKLKVELIFHLGETTIREKVEMMFPMWATQGWLQPFRFVDLTEASKSALEASLQQFIQGLQAPTT